MTRCEAFYNKCKTLLESEDLEALEDFCKKDARETIWRIKKYIEFCEKFTLPFGNVAESALRPLMAEPELEVQEKAVSIIKERLASQKIMENDVISIISEVKGKPQIEEKELDIPVPCSGPCHTNTKFPKHVEGKPYCSVCFDRLSRGEITLESQKPTPKPPVEEAPKPPRVEKHVYEPGAWREQMRKPVSRMDQWLAEELSRRGVPIKIQEPVCIKFVVPEVIVEKGDKPLAVFLDTAETHGKRTLVDMENRELLAKRGFRVLELEYDAYTEEQRQLIISEVLSAIQPSAHASVAPSESALRSL